MFLNVGVRVKQFASSLSSASKETFAEVTANGAQPVMPPTTEPWGQRTCYIADPEGNLVEIGSFVKE